MKKLPLSVASLQRVIHQQHKEFEKLVRDLKSQFANLSKLASCQINIYSASPTEVCIGMDKKQWHRIVCNYDGDRCIGSPRPHWTTRWSMQENGFHLEAMHDEHWQGWFGQYKDTNQLKYDQLPQDILRVHHTALVAHIKSLSIWYPCHLYDDMNGILHRP